VHALNQAVADLLQLTQGQQVRAGPALTTGGARNMRKARGNDSRQLALQLRDLGAQRIDRGPLAGLVIDYELLRDDDRPTSQLTEKEGPGSSACLCPERGAADCATL
jgi:hypothetical protein